MKTLALQNGDLVVTPTGHMTVSGAEKIKLELSLALGEGYGDDRYHPNWGSYMINFIGQPVDASTQMRVEAEVVRVINNYITIQADEILRDQLNTRRSRFATNDVVQKIESVVAQVSFDKVYVKVNLRTQAGESLSITKSVSL